MRKTPAMASGWTVPTVGTMTIAVVVSDDGGMSTATEWWFRMTGGCRRLRMVDHDDSGGVTVQVRFY